MWPFDRGAAREYLRVGALGIERWKGVDGGLALAAEHRFDRSPAESTRSIATALLALYPEGAASNVTVFNGLFLFLPSAADLMASSVPPRQ